MWESSASASSSRQRHRTLQSRGSSTTARSRLGNFASDPWPTRRQAVRHADYPGSWLEVFREDNRAIVRAARAVPKAFGYLLAFAPEAEADAGNAEAAEAVL